MRLRSTAVTALISILAAASALGQDLENKVSLSQSLTPSPHVTVTNNHSARITGMVILVSSTVAPYRKTETIWFDPAVHFRHDHPMEAGASLPFPVGPTDLAPRLKAQLMAVEFEDGTSAGDPQWLSKMHLRRQAAYDEINTLTGLLNQALSTRQPTNQIVATLNGIHDSLKTGSLDWEARFSARFVVESTIDKLQRDTVNDGLGDPHDPQKIIPIVMADFAEWRGALKRYDRNIG